MTAPAPIRPAPIRAALGLASSVLLAACSGPWDRRCAPTCVPAVGPVMSVRSDLATPEALADAAELDAALAEVGTVEGAEVRALALVRQRWTEGRLRPALGRLAERFVAAHPAVARRGVDVDRVVAFVGAQLWLLGSHPTIPSVAAPSWDELARTHAAAAAVDGAVPREQRSYRHFAHAITVAGGVPFTSGNDVEVLVDGPASWAVRERLLAVATGEVLVASWAVYDDRTGREAMDALLARAAAGVRVHLVVDGQTAALPPYDDEVARLDTEARRRDLPVEVTRWRDAARPFDGMHWKVLIAHDPRDGDTMVLGGMNFGDMYSHKDRAPGRGWRDTDVVVRGPAVAEARARFDGRFRAGAPRQARDVPEDGDEHVAVVTHAPGGDDPVLRSLLAAIDGARRAVDLENAYVVRIPSVEQALLAAVARNVRVRILTNSMESCDEPVVAQAIVRSVGALADAGVEVWLRRGSTLHSKFAAIDGVFAQVGSYNLHPRSHRLEHEVAVNVLGARTAKRLHEVFDADLGAATRVRSSAELPPPTDPVGRLAWLLFRDLL